MSAVATATAVVKETEEDDEFISLDLLTQTVGAPCGGTKEGKVKDGVVEEEADEVFTDDSALIDSEAELDPDDPDASDSETEGPSTRVLRNYTTSPSKQFVKKNLSPSSSKNVASFMKKPVPKKEAVKSSKKPDYCNDVMEEDGNGLRSPDGHLVYGKKVLTFSSAEQLLLVGDTAHDGKKSVCSSIPVYCPNVKGGVTFLIDAGALYKIEDIPVDGYGSWTAGGSRASSRSRYYVKMSNGDLMRVDSTYKSSREPSLWDLKLTQTRYVHPAAGRCFRKFTYSVRDRNGGVKRWAAVSYQWLTAPFPFKPLPHGNCKGGTKEMKPFQRTYPSVLAAMKQQLPMKMPKHVYHDIISAYGIGDERPIPGIPRDRKQLYNMNREAAKEVGAKVDHRKWRKTGPGAGLPPGPDFANFVYEGEGGEITYVIETSSEIPGISDEQFQAIQEGAASLCEDEDRFQPSIDNKNGMGVEDGFRWYTVREDENEPARLRCSGCAEWRNFKIICRHTLAVAQTMEKVAEHLEYVKYAAAQRLQKEMPEDMDYGKIGKAEGTIIVTRSSDGGLITEDGERLTLEEIPQHSTAHSGQEVIITDGEVTMNHPGDFHHEEQQHEDQLSSLII